MAGQSDKPGRDKQFTAVFALLATAVCSAVIVLATPRAIVPHELPPLVLDADASARAIEADARLAAEAPGGVDVDALAAGYLEEGRAERAAPTEQYRIELRQRALRELAARVFARVGPSGVKALRAQALERFLQAREGRVEDATELAGVLGTFPELLRTYGLTNADDELVAPELCLRASFKARWNLIHGLEPTRDFATIEQQAFEGFIALHAGATPSARRAQAARAFYVAGGHRSAQALAVWLVHGGFGNDALRLMQKAHGLRGELFARNYALGIAAGAP